MTNEDGTRPPHLDLFRYLAAEENSDYIAIMDRFTASLLADMPAHVVVNQLAQVGIALDQDIVESRCRQLVRWGNLVPSLRDARVSTVADYLRARSRFQASSLGGRVHRGAVEIMEASDGTREVARELLGQIADSLERILNQLELADPAEQADQIAGLVTSIFNNQRLFTASVTDFYAYLAGILTRFDLASDEYSQFKVLLLDYVDLITADVNRHSPLIADALDRLMLKIDALLDALGSVQGLTLGETTTVERSQGRTRVEWEQLHQWYSGRGEESGPGQLRAAAGQALGQLIANAKRMLDSTASGFSRRADLLRLATWFDDASDVDADRIFAATFGAHPSRHLLLGPDEPDPRVGPTTSWLDADPIDVPLSLRDRGDRVSRGRSSRVPDPAVDRRKIDAIVHAEAQRLRNAAIELAAAGNLNNARLSPIARDVMLEEFSRLLSEQPNPSIAYKRTNHDLGLTLHSAPGGETVVHSTDGSVTIHGLRLAVLPIDQIDYATEEAL